MNTPLQSANLTADELNTSTVAAAEELGEGEVEHHIHMPNPSLWPLILSVAIAVTMGGLLFVNTFPWISIIAAPFVLISILGWALENPFASHEAGRVTFSPGTYEPGKLPPLAEQLLQDAQEVANETVTVSSTEWSAHPVHIEIEEIEPEGVVLALYGKVELAVQRKELEERLRSMPGVINVKNFLVAEDDLLNAVNGRIEKLRADGKLEGARDIRVLVENYIVSLYGYTPTTQMKYMLEREILGIPGLRVVVNHIGLNEDIPGNLGRTSNKVGN